MSDYTYPNAWWPRVPEVRQLDPRQLPKILVESLLKPGDPKRTVNAARPMSEFVRAQQQKEAARKQRTRPGPVAPTINQPFAPGLWVSQHEYAAWTLDGQLVVVEDRDTGSSMVRRPTEAERRDLFAADRLITAVIAFYPGDSLDHGAVTRYLGHNDIDGALEAALERATEAERRATEEAERREREQAAARGFRGGPLKKSRFRPEGSFVVYRLPAEDERMPSFAIAAVEGAPPAFEDRRHAIRFLQKRRRLATLPVGCRITRVLASANVRPTFRHGFKLPRHRREIVALVHKEPRLVRPQLHVEWLSRYFQDDDGVWRLKPFKLRRTVRHRARDRVLERLHETYVDAGRRIEERNMRGRLGQKEDPTYEAAINSALRVEAQAERLLPAKWFTHIEYSPPPDDGHWIRTSFEFKGGRAGRVQRRLVELRIDDFAGLLDQFGRELEFWMIKDGTNAAPRWVLPVSYSCLVGTGAVA